MLFRVFFQLPAQFARQQDDPDLSLLTRIPVEQMVSISSSRRIFPWLRAASSSSRQPLIRIFIIVLDGHQGKTLIILCVQRQKQAEL